ncbi:class I SAM-dependent methyltransferase [Arenibacter algicola]|uniref:methyltransferase domain-containing protein n=1 Tax=Arenibacter algicola TaxID=616991 RepID=UPI001C066BB1|nr:methyltransferase domain-containing protein [Arenibacter algicola]MBU2903433.1 class I SAM-dependent methyltransferase [Arenibacter algicola]
MFESLPKIRTRLPLAYEKIYDEHYQNNREGNGKTTSISKKMESWMHKIVAKDVVLGCIDGIKTLEIGAGNLNHLKYEPNGNSYDVVEPYSELLNSSCKKNKIGTTYTDISQISNKKYDRIISIACFEHVLNLPLLVAHSCKLLNTNGQLRVAIPNEGTFLWKLGTMVTGFEFKRKYGLDYEILMKHEHVNTADEIDAILNFFFKDVKCKVFGINKKIAFYRFYICKTPNTKNVKYYFSTKTNSTSNSN